MAGETTNIMEFAEIVSEKIFSFFGWQITGPTNENFSCIKIDDHQKTKHPCHPCDAVFHYEEPYINRRSYILTDFKSYAKGSLTKTSIIGALRELSKAIDCASVSSEFQEKYINIEGSFDIHGLLFIYNHDGGFDSDFNHLFKDFSPDTLKVPRNSRIYVLGPDRIKYLLSIISDAKRLIAENKLPLEAKPCFFYPDRVLHYSKSHRLNSATAEQILGPLLIIPFDFLDLSKSRLKGVKIYYDGKGDTAEEFQILFDYFFRNQLVDEQSTIDLRMQNPSSDFHTKFKNAKENFIESLWGLSEISNRLDRIKVTRVDETVNNFSSTDVGMQRREAKQ